MKSISKADQIIYEYYLKASYETRKHLTDERRDALLETMHFFYRGISGDTDFVKALESSSQAKLLQGSTRSNLLRSVEAVEHILDKASDYMKDELSEEDTARVQNALNDDTAKDDLDKRLKALGDVESIFGYSPLPGSGTAEAVQEFSKRKKMVESIMSNSKIRKILDMYGQFLSYMNQVKRQRRFPDASNIVDVELGNDLPKMVFDEAIMFATPELEFLANYKLASREMLQYRNEAEKETSKGDFQILVDTSGSTYRSFDENGTDILDVEIAFALAVIKFAHDDGRKIKVWTFNDYTRLVSDYNGSLAHVFGELLKLSSSGSTCAQDSLSKVLSSSDDTNGDIMMITDGSFSLAPMSKGNKRIIAALVTQPWNPEPHSQNHSGVIDGYFHVSKMEDFKELSLTMI